MNILFVATDYPARGKPTTGFPNYLYRVSQALIQMGHTPIILAAGRWDNRRIEQGIEIWTIQIEYINFKHQVYNYAINALRKGYILNKHIKKIALKRKIDVIQFTSLEGIAMFYRENIPSVLRLSSYAKTYFSTYQTYSPVNVKIMSLFERLSAKKCRIIISPCYNTAKAFGKDCKRRVKTIETPFINDVQELDNKYIDLYLKDKKYILFFGTLYAEKGILVISEILERFLKNHSDYTFVFVGNAYNIKGERIEQLLKRKAGKYADHILILSALPHKQLYPIIIRADFVVLPSLMDNLPNACIEAMYFGRVVIGTNGASFEQLITHEENGLLCKIGDSGDLYNKMLTAATMSENKKIEMGKKAKQRIDKLKPEYVVNQLVELYENLVKK